MAKLHEQIPHVSTPQLIRETGIMRSFLNRKPTTANAYRLVTAAEGYHLRIEELRRREAAGDALAAEFLTDFPQG